MRIAKRKMEVLLLFIFHKHLIFETNCIVVWRLVSWCQNSDINFSFPFLDLSVFTYQKHPKILFIHIGAQNSKQVQVFYMKKDMKPDQKSM